MNEESIIPKIIGMIIAYSIIIIIIGILFLVSMRVVRDSMAPITETFEITNHTTPQAFITKQIIEDVKTLQIYNVAANQWQNLSQDAIYVRYGYFVIDSPLLIDANFTKIRITYSYAVNTYLRRQ